MPEEETHNDDVITINQLPMEDRFRLAGYTSGVLVEELLDRGVLKRCRSEEYVPSIGVKTAVNDGVELEQYVAGKLAWELTEFLAATGMFEFEKESAADRDDSMPPNDLIYSQEITVLDASTHPDNIGMVEGEGNA